MLNLSQLNLFSRPLGVRQYGLRLDTFIRLRWLVVLGQSVTLVIVYWGLGFPLPIWPAFGLVALTAVTNFFLRARYPRPHQLQDPAAGLLLAYDVTQLTALLYLTGGIDNPFFSFYLAPFLISATALSPRTTFLIGLLVTVMVTALSFYYLPLPWYRQGIIDFPLLYRASEWVAMFVQVGFIGIYTWKIAEETRQLSDALAATELVLEREQHLSALDGLAAAAAHELGTPLATIALVAKEIDRAIPKNSPHAADIKLLREQSDRCRMILRRISSLESGDAPYDRMPLSQVLEEAAAPHRDFGAEITVAMPADRAGEPVIARNPGVIYGIGNLVENAVDFAKSKVSVTATWDAAEVEVEVADDGPGFSADIIGRIGDPYVSLRRRNDEAPGGLGLGIFIAKTLLERSGATFSIGNREAPETGAIARIRWPREKLASQIRMAEPKYSDKSLISAGAASLASGPAAE